MIKRVKKSRPISRVLSSSIIYLGLSLPKGSSNLPSELSEQLLNFGLFGLSTPKVYPKQLLPIISVSSYLTFSPSPDIKSWLYFSVALAVPVKRRDLPVRKWDALCCPDFPLPIIIRRAAIERPASAKVLNKMYNGICFLAVLFITFVSSITEINTFVRLRAILNPFKVISSKLKLSYIKRCIFYFIFMNN